MATLSIQISDAHLARVLDAIAKKYNWDPGGGLTKTQFARLTVATLIKAAVLEQERQDQIDAAAPQPVDVS